jgi:putative MATE family efflux protein
MPEVVEPTLTGKLAGMSLPRQVLALAIWPLLEQVMAFAVGTVDLVLAGRLSPVAKTIAGTDALGVTSFIGWLMMLMEMAVGIGAAAIIARAVGARHRRLANAALGQALVLAVLVGVGIGAAIAAAAPAIGRFCHLSGLALDYCVTYLRLIALAAPLTSVQFVGMSCLRAAGDTRSPFLVMLVVNIVNVIASVLLTFGPAPIGGHEVAGIAGGTAIAWAAGCILVVALLIRGSPVMRLRWLRLQPHAHTLQRIVRVGMPNFFESAGMWAGNFVVVKIVGLLGAQADAGYLGAHMIAVRIESLSFLPGVAMGTAAATLVGQYLGAGSIPRAKRAALLCWLAGMTMMFMLGLMFICIPARLVWLISDAPLHLTLSPPLLRIAGCIQVFFASYVVLSHVLRGAGDTRTAMLVSYASTYLVRVPGAWFIGVHLGYGLTGVWLALCGELVVRGSAFAFFFLRGKWAHVRV